MDDGFGKRNLRWKNDFDVLDANDTFSHSRSTLCSPREFFQVGRCRQPQFVGDFAKFICRESVIEMIGENFRTLLIRKLR